MGIHRSREPSAIYDVATSHGDGEEDEEVRQAVPRSMSPPPVPSSPAPRAPPARAVPAPVASHAPVGETEAADDLPMPGASVGRPLPQPPAPARSVGVIDELAVAPTSAAATSEQPNAAAVPGTVTGSGRSSSRDLDLMQSSRWWRHGTNPLRLPPTVAGRPDAVMYVDGGQVTKRGRTKHT